MGATAKLPEPFREKAISKSKPFSTRPLSIDLCTLKIGPDGHVLRTRAGRYDRDITHAGIERQYGTAIDPDTGARANAGHILYAENENGAVEAGRAGEAGEILKDAGTEPAFEDKVAIIDRQAVDRQPLLLGLQIGRDIKRFRHDQRPFGRAIDDALAVHLAASFHVEGHGEIRAVHHLIATPAAGDTARNILGPRGALFRQRPDEKQRYEQNHRYETDHQKLGAR